MGIAVFLDVAPAARLVHADGAEHDQERGGCDPFLPMGEPGNLLDHAAIGDHAKYRGLFIPTGRGQASVFKHIPDHLFGDRSLLELADADALFQQGCDQHDALWVCSNLIVLEIKFL